MLNKEPEPPKRNCLARKARQAFDEALQRQQQQEAEAGGGGEFRKKVTESLEALDKEGRGIQTTLLFVLYLN